MNPGSKTTPLALRMEVERIHALHEHVVIASLDYATVPHVERARRISVKQLGEDPFQITFVTVRTGYRERLDVPGALAQARDRGLLDADLDLERAAYLVSRMTIMPTRAPGMARWRKRLFIAMARNAASPVDSFKLPPNRTVMLGTQVGL